MPPLDALGAAHDTTYHAIWPDDDRIAPARDGVRSEGVVQIVLEHVLHSMDVRRKRPAPDDDRYPHGVPGLLPQRLDDGLI